MQFDNVKRIFYVYWHRKNFDKLAMGVVIILQRVHHMQDHIFRCNVIMAAVTISNRSRISFDTNNSVKVAPFFYNLEKHYKNIRG